jgi:hypothetical protein
MDVLITALSSDPADRPTAARFRDQLANVPVTSISTRGALVGAGEDTSSALPGAGSLAPGHSAPSSSHIIAVTAVTADSQRPPGQVASAEAIRGRRTRRAVIPVLAAALVTVIALGADWLISEPAPAALPVTVTSNAPPDPPSSSAGRVIQLENPADAAKPFQTVEIQGTYRGGADTSLRVQRWEGGQWLDFPLPTKTDQTGQFTAHVDLGGPGRYRLRLLDPNSGVTSTPSELVIKS